MGEKQRVESVRYFSFFPFLRDAIFACLQFSSFFLLFLDYPLALFCLFVFLRVGAIANGCSAIAAWDAFCYRGLWGGNGFLGGNGSF